MTELEPSWLSWLWPTDEDDLLILPSRPGRVRLRTLSNLRWLAVGGQSVTLLLVHFGLGYPLPLLACAIAVAASAALNGFLTLRYEPTHRLSNRAATAYLAYDVVQLAALLYLTGGIMNPFSLMFIAPVVIAAATLDLGNTLLLAIIALIAVSVIGVVHKPLPWPPDEPLALPPLFLGGIWASLVIGIGFTSIYAWRIASEAARMQAGLSATQLALAREHRMASIGALAAAAAHELGSPLGTIAIVSRELERSLPADSPEAEDARLLRQEAERCRGILTRLARPEESVMRALDRLPLGAMLDDIASPHRNGDLAIQIEMAPAAQGLAEPKVWRSPALLHGLGNVIANAADFAHARVRVIAVWNENEIRVSVQDDGPGFAPDIIERIGEPYVTSRPGTYALGETELSPTDAFTGQQGMGLGFFIAKTLIEQTGGTMRARNVSSGGARVTARWPRGAIDGDQAPGRAGLL